MPTLYETTGNVSKGTRFRIAYNFKSGYTYTIYVTMAADINTTGYPTGPYLRVDVNNNGGGGTTGCNGAENVNPNYSGNPAAIQVLLDTYSELQFSSFIQGSNQPTLEITAIPAPNGGSKTIRLRKIRIVETAPQPTFTITPPSVTIPCGTATQQTFTVNNVYNSPGTLSYDWNLGTANNGWTCSNSAAPQTFTTSNNSITLTSSSTATSLSNVSVTVKLNGSNCTTLTSNVTLGTPTFNFNISGDDIICNISIYDIPSLPSGASVAWSIPSGAGPVLQLSQNNPSVNQLTITNQKWYGVSTTLTANVTGLPCGVTSTAVKSITNDNSTSSTVAYPYYQEECTFYNVLHASQSGSAYSNSSPTFVHQGCMVYVNLGDMTNRSVNLTGSGQPLYWNFGPTSYYQNTLYFQLPLGSGGIPFTFEITGNGACYTRTLLFFSYSNNGRYAYAATPNPVKNLLTVTVKENEEYLKLAKEQSTKDKLLFTMNIYDISTNTLQLSQRSSIGTLKHQINTSRLKKGYYVLQIINGKDRQSIKFLKE